MDDGSGSRTPEPGYTPIAVTGRKRLSRRARTAITLGAIAVIVLGLGGGAAALVWGASRDEAPPVATPAPSPSASPTPESEPTEAPATGDNDGSVHVIAMGDMLPHDSVNANALGADGTYDYGQFFSGIAPQLAAAEVTFCNQEVPSAGVDFGISGYPTFNAPAEFAQALQATAGCDLVNIATNHSADLGAAGIAATRGVWDGLAPAVVDGANRTAEEQRSVPVFEQGGITFALVSFAEYSNAPIDGVSLNMMSDTALVTDLMTQARAAADVVIVSAHWGTEDSHEVNDQQRAFAQQVADLGADVIVGTGPHVLQPTAWLDRADGGRTLVWYSIGNMFNTQIELDQRTGVIAGFDAVRDSATGAVSIANPTGILTYMHYDWTAEQEAANDLLARTNLSITPLVQADALLATTRFGVTAEQQVATSSAILGPDVTILPE
ncbi:CapA family protein [Leucobacter musarum]|uniref:CapA family protein n=1 Tax=Leucobacter musarum TaxID=1930747 RepID=UPI0006A7CFAE|nr:CapA family protein [Leucobacter musarum]